MSKWHLTRKISWLSSKKMHCFIFTMWRLHRCSPMQTLKLLPFHKWKSKSKEFIAFSKSLKTTSRSTDVFSTIASFSKKTLWKNWWGVALMEHLMGHQCSGYNSALWDTPKTENPQLFVHFVWYMDFTSKTLPDKLKRTLYHALK